MREPIRWGIVGCGDVTEKKSGPAFRKVPGSTLIAVSRRDRDKARDYAVRHGVTHWTDDPAALIAHPDVDAVYVATPPASHAEWAIAAARAGKPAYVEKPMAATTAQAEAMREAFRDAGVPLFVAYYRRALPRFLAVRDALARLGAIRFVRAALTRPSLHLPPGQPLPWRVRPEIAGGGLFVDLAAHTLDLLDWLLGPIAEVQAIADNQLGAYPAEDVVSMAFRFESGVLGSGMWCFCADGRLDTVEIVGDRGHLSFATFDDVPLRITDESGTREVAVPHPEHIQQPLIEAVVQTLLGRGSCPSTGDTAIRTTRVMEAALAGYVGGGGRKLA